MALSANRVLQLQNKILPAPPHHHTHPAFSSTHPPTRRHPSCSAATSVAAGRTLQAGGPIGDMQGKVMDAIDMLKELPKKKHEKVEMVAAPQYVVTQQPQYVVAPMPQYPPQQLVAAQPQQAPAPAPVPEPEPEVKVRTRTRAPVLVLLRQSVMIDPGLQRPACSPVSVPDSVLGNQLHPFKLNDTF